MNRYGKKIIAMMVAILLASNIILPHFSYALEKATVESNESNESISNEVIRVSADPRGSYAIKTTKEGNPLRPDDGNKKLLFNSDTDNTSYTTIRVDGEDYIFGKDYGYSVARKARLKSETEIIDGSLVTAYEIGTGANVIRILQTMTLIEDKSNTNYGNVFIQYALENKTGTSAEIGIRILQDIKVGNNDGPLIKIEDSFYEKEEVFEGVNIPDVWRTTDNEFAPTVVAFARTNGWGNIKPDKMILGHWQGLSQSIYDYTVDNDVNFTLESSYGARDTAVAYYWEPKPIANNEIVSFETYYGIGQVLDKEFTYAANISAPTKLVVNEEKTAYVEDGVFEIAVMVENNLPNSEEIYDVMAYLSVEDSAFVDFESGESPLKGTQIIKRGGQYTFRWKLKAKAVEDYNALKYKVQLYDSRNIYKEGDVLPEKKQVGDVKLDEIYTVSKVIVLPSLTGKPPQIAFHSVSPEKIYYRGRNQLSISASGTTLLRNKDSWVLEYKPWSSDDSEYTVVPSDQIYVSEETNSLEITFSDDHSFVEDVTANNKDFTGLNFRLRVINDIYIDKNNSDLNIEAGDTINVPGLVIPSVDEQLIPRSYGLLAIVSDQKDNKNYSQVIPLKGEDELKKLKNVLKVANNNDVSNKPDREILSVIRGDVSAIVNNGVLDRYVVYANRKKATINNVLEFRSAQPLIIQYTNDSNNISRDNINPFTTGGGLSQELKDAINATTIKDNISSLPSSTTEFVDGFYDDQPDFPYQEKVTTTSPPIDDQPAGVSILGVGTLSIGSDDGYDFWDDVFVLNYRDGYKYSANVNASSDYYGLDIELKGIGSVLNKVLDNLPVELNSVQLGYDNDKELDVLKFGGTAELSMLPGNGNYIPLEQALYSTEGYEGLRIDEHIDPASGIAGLVADLGLDIKIDSMDDFFYDIKGHANIAGKLFCNVEFGMYRESRNGVWYLSDLVAALGYKKGKPKKGKNAPKEPPKAINIYKFGGGIRNLEQLTNPFYDKDKSDPTAITTLVAILGMEVYEMVDSNHIEGTVNKRQMKVEADKATLKKLPFFEDMFAEIVWEPISEKETFRFAAGAEVNALGILVGEAKIEISDIFFEASIWAKIKIPKKVPLVGGKTLAKASLGMNISKIWGSIGISFGILGSVDIGFTVWYSGKFKFKTSNLPIKRAVVASLADMDFGSLENKLTPKGNMYDGTTTDENGKEVNFSFGTNVEIEENATQKSSFIEMKALNEPMISMMSSPAQLADTPTALTPMADLVYLKEDLAPNSKYKYDVNLSADSATEIKLEYTPEVGVSPKVEFYVPTTTTDAGGKFFAEEKSFDFNVATETDTDTSKEYIVITGFAEKFTDKDLIVVSNVELANYSVSEETPLTETTKEYVITKSIEGSYVYDLTLDLTAKTKLVFEHAPFMGGANPVINYYVPDSTGSKGEIIVGNKDFTYNEINHVYDSKNFVTATGFAPEENSKQVYVVSDTSLINYNTYTDTIKHDVDEQNANDYVYEFTLNTNDRTNLPILSDESINLTFYEVTGTTYDGRSIVGNPASGITSNEVTIGSKKMTVFEGFTPNLQEAKYIATSDKQIEEGTIPNMLTITIPEKISTYGHDYVVEFISTEDLSTQDVFYIQDSNGLEVTLPSSMPSNEREIDGNTFYNRLMKFNNPGTYKVFSTTKLDSNHTSVYTIEKLPRLNKGSITAVKNANNSEKIDISWTSDGERYTANMQKGTDKTSYSFYLVDNSDVIEQLADTTGFTSNVGYLIGEYDIQNGGEKEFTATIPKGVPSGTYRIRVVQDTPGLCHREEFSSNTYVHTNPYEPNAVTNVSGTNVGNGNIEVRWDDTEGNSDMYVIQLLDEFDNVVENSGEVEAKGDARSIVIGGYYEEDVPDKPNQKIQKGLVPGTKYKVSVTPRRSITETFSVKGKKGISIPFMVQSPTPADVTLEFIDVKEIDTVETINYPKKNLSVNDDGEIVETTEKITEELIVKTINTKSPTIAIKSNKDVKSTILLDKIKIQEGTNYVTEETVKLAGLTEGVHYIDILSTNRAGDSTIETIKFYVDTKAPILMIDSPTNSEYIDAIETEITVKGRTEIGAEITVNGAPINVNDKGVFEDTVPVSTDNVKTQLVIKSEDKIGNIMTNTVEVMKNVGTMKDILITSDIPSIETTLRKPVYETIDKQVRNAITGETVIVPMSTDKILSYDTETISENIATVGNTYKLTVKGIKAETPQLLGIRSVNEEILVDNSNVSYELVDGYASIDDDGTLIVENTGDIIVKASYTVVGDDKATTNLDESYTFEQFISIRAEYDSDEPPTPPVTPPVTPPNSGGSNSDSDSEEDSGSTTDPSDKVIVIEKPNKSDIGLIVRPETFERLKDNVYEKIIVRTDFYSITFDKTKKETDDDSGKNNSVLVPVDTEAIISYIPEEELERHGTDETVFVPLESIDLSLSLESVNKEEIVEQIAYDNLKEDVTYVNFKYHGKLPTRATVALELGNKYNNDEMYIYYYNKESGKLELYGQVKCDKTGVVYFEIDHCSDYILVNDLLINNDRFVDTKETKTYINGMPNGTFAPDKYVTRAEIATMISKLLVEENGNIDAKFADDDMWAKNSIEKLASLGYINGYSDRTFRPNNNLTRAELAKILINIIDPTRTQSTRQGTFTDIDNNWAKKEIMQCYRLSLINGFDGKYRPNDYVTRAEVVATINRLVGRIKPDSIHNPFSDLERNHWAHDEILKAINN